MTNLAFRGRGLLLLIGVVALWGANLQPAQAAGVPYHSGDVFVSVGAGLVRHFDSNGILLDTLDTTTNSDLTGLCFDAASNLYATDWSSGQMSKFDSMGNLLQASWGGPFSAWPEDCLQARDGSIWTGEVKGANMLRQWTSSGTQLSAFSPATEYQGFDWFDLNPDQCVFDYTSEGPSLKRFNVCTNSQLPDLATNLPGSVCFAVKIRADDSIFVACSSEINLVDAAGNVLKSYPQSNLPGSSSRLFAANLDPDGTSFWTADVDAGNIYRIDIATGTVITHFVATPAGHFISGLAVFGEPIVSADTVPPICALTGVLPGPPKQVKITVQDVDSGLQSITVTKNVNATVDVPAFTPGTKGPVVVTGTKTDQSKGAQVGLRATDVAGNVTDCDPELLTIKPGEVQRIRDVPRSEHRLTLSNGSPGLRTLRVTVNRKTFELGHLRSSEVRVLDISSAMVAGSHNTVTIRGYGRRGSSAEVVLSD